MSNFYREQQLTIKPGHLQEIAYGYGENPNHFYVNNLSNTTLYCGITMIPSAKAAEMKVEANSAKIVARRDGSTRFYIYNASNTNEAQILLTSFSEAFNPVILALMNQNLSVDMQGVTIEGGGTINEISCSLPGGNNSIGFVGLNAGGNHIGSVGVDAVPGVVETAAGNINAYMKTIADATAQLQTLTGDLKALQAASNEVWTAAKITQLMAAVQNIAAVAGGEEFTGTLAIRSEALSAQLVWNLADEGKYINNLNYIRCTAGSITVAMNDGGSTITLAEGDVINDVAGMIESITITPVGGAGSFEMLYSFVAV